MAAFICLSVFFILLNVLYSKIKLYRSNWIGGILIVLVLIFAGTVRVSQHNELNHQGHFSRSPAEYLLVRINSEPVTKNGWTRFTVVVNAARSHQKYKTTNGTLLIVLKDTLPKIGYGDELVIPAKYTPMDPPFVPAEFNYKKYLAHQNIFYQQFLFPGQYRVLVHNTGNPLISYSLQLRKRLVGKLKANMRDTNAVAVASTLILGYKADLSDYIRQAYAKSGTVHILSVSGAHVGVIYLLLMFILAPLNRLKYGKVLRVVVIIMIIWCYAMLTGFSPAVCRAAVMISMVVAGRAYNRYINLLNIMALSAFILLLYNPLYIVDVGFQLSYFAVFGLIAFQPIVYDWLHFKNSWISKFLWMPCSVSIAAQIITFPLSAFYFHQFPVYFLLSNLVITLPMVIIMYSGLFFLLLPQIPFLSKALALVLEHTILLLNRFLIWIEHLPFATVSKIWLHPVEYLLLYAIIVYLFAFSYYKKSWQLITSLACMLLLSISTGIKRTDNYRTTNIAWLNVGKHPAIVFRNTDNAVVLTDLNDIDKTFRYAVQPYLDSCQIANCRIRSLQQDIRLPWMIKKGGLIQFLNQRIFIINSPLSGDEPGPKINAVYLYITANPHVSLNSIGKKFDYQQIIMDGSNSNAYLKKMQAAADSIKTDIKILKRNISLITSSN